MSLFWLGLLLFAVLLFYPVYRVIHYKQGNEHRLLELNRDVYQQRLAELEAQHAAKEIDAQQLHDMKLELQTNLLADMEGVDTQASQPDKLWPIAAVTAVALVIVCGLYLASGRLDTYQKWQQEVAKLPELRQMLNDPQQQMTASQLSSLALALRTQLADHPNNADDWLLLGQITSYLGQVKQGLHAYEKALVLEPENDVIQRFYGMTLAATGDPADAQRAYVLLKGLIAKHPDDTDLANGIAFAFAEMGRKVEAAMIWRDVALRLPEGSTRRASIMKIVEQLMAGQPAEHGTSAAHGMADTAPVSDSAPQVEASGFSVPVSLSLAAPLADKLPQHGFLFVFAQAVNGSKAPLAVKRMAIPSFPLTVTLSEADAMMDGWSLANVDSFELIARISVDNDGGAASGELEGRSGVLKKSEINGGIALVISQIIEE